MILALTLAILGQLGNLAFINVMANHKNSYPKLQHLSKMKKKCKHDFYPHKESNKMSCESKNESI